MNKTRISVETSSCRKINWISNQFVDKIQRALRLLIHRRVPTRNVEHNGIFYPSPDWSGLGIPIKMLTTPHLATWERCWNTFPWRSGETAPASACHGRGMPVKMTLICRNTRARTKSDHSSSGFRITNNRRDNRGQLPSTQLTLWKNTITN